MIKEMNIISQRKFISEFLIIVYLIVFVDSQRHLTDAERRIVEGFTGINHGPVNLLDQRGSGNLANILELDSHVDLPGEHGNQSPHPVIHRHRPGTVSLVDHQGQHGNLSPMPTVHRENGLEFPRSNPGWQLGSNRQIGTQLPIAVDNRQNGAHVDLPGEHGNHSPHPVVHRGSKTHVDLPGQHGNDSPHPVIHRKDGAHVDLPGEHGNHSPRPVVHRQDGPHVDMPGEHGNHSPHPVVHRQDGPHVDMPGEHRNHSPHPVVHRQDGLHVDMPGEHGNHSPLTVVHREDGPHVDMPGEHGNHSPLPVVHRGNLDTHNHAQHGSGLNHQGALSENTFIDPITGTPVVLPGQNNRLLHDNIGANFGSNFASLDSRRNEFPNTFRDRVNPGFIQPQTFGPFGFRGSFDFRRPVDFRSMQGPGGPVFGGPFGPPPFSVSPVPMRLMRRPMPRFIPGQPMIGELPPPFPLTFRPPPRPARVGIRGLLAGAIGGLIGRLLRQ